MVHFSIILTMFLPFMPQNNAMLCAIHQQKLSKVSNFLHTHTCTCTPTYSCTGIWFQVFPLCVSSQAISQLEEQIKNIPPSHVTPSNFLSLFSAYDLESSQSQAKKLSWLPYLGQHAPEGFNMMSLGLVIPTSTIPQTRQS